MRHPTPAVVVLSGGQDSMTCLALARVNAPKVHAISFDYGQRHKVELQAAATICEKWNVPHTVVEVGALRSLVTSALTNTTDNVSANHPRLKNLPASFVPARNALFLTLAHAYAQEIGAGFVYTGVCQTDYSGYPDCRDVFVLKLQKALNVGYEADIKFETPLMYVNKAATFRMAHELGVLPDIIEHSHTCYNGERDKVHAWGRGCGECPACKLRAKGWDEFLAGRQGEHA